MNSATEHTPATTAATDTTETAYVSSLYSVGAETWQRFLNGVPYQTERYEVQALADDISDGIGGSNIAMIDQGDTAWLAFPAPASIARDRVLVIHVAQPSADEWREQVDPDELFTRGAWWQVVHSKQAPWRNSDRNLAEDAPIKLARALAYVIEMSATEHTNEEG